MRNAVKLGQLKLDLRKVQRDIQNIEVKTLLGVACYVLQTAVEVLEKAMARSEYRKSKAGRSGLAVVGKGTRSK